MYSGKFITPNPTEPVSKHASVCHLERELKALREENKKLRLELEESRSALKSITFEASHEKFDERRVNLLKLQLIQLQRQVLLMSEALGSRSSAFIEVANTLNRLLERLRYYIGLEVRGAEVPVPRAELITMVNACESARLTLSKSVENCSKENLAQPQMFMNPFLKPQLMKEFSLLDCCLGKSECLNLKHVAHLESKLASLYKELIKVSEYLTQQVELSIPQSAGGHVPAIVREREGTLVLRAGAMARDCASDLLSLSLLLPSAPWPPAKRPAVGDITFEKLASSLPPLPRGRAGEVEHFVTAALQACNYRCLFLGQEAVALREEIRFHQSVYQLQVDYILQAFKALGEGYNEFEQSTNEILVQPMKKLLDAYRDLKNNVHKDGLREFLTILKEQEEQWTELVNKLDPVNPHYQSGSRGVSDFGEQFLKNLDHMLLEQQTQRDKAAARNEELKKSQQQLEDELQTIIEVNIEQQRELNFCDRSAVTDTDINSATASFTRRELLEGSAGLQSQINKDQTDKSIEKKQMGFKSMDTSRALSRKPWDNSTDVRPYSNETGAELEDFVKRAEEKGEWSQMNKQRTESSISTWLRPWLDDQYTEGGKLTCKDSEWKNGDPSVPSDSRTQTLNSSKPLVNYLQHVEGDGPNSYTETNDKIILESMHLRGTSASSLSQHKSGGQKPPFRLPPDQDILSAKLTGHTGRPLAGKQNAKGDKKDVNFKPNLSVAKRTLSLKRYGSMNKLSELIGKEQASKISFADGSSVPGAQV